MRRAFLPALVATLALLRPAAAADGDGRLEVDVVLDRASAVVRITQTVANASGVPRRLALPIDVPSQATVTRLRTAAGMTGPWSEGELVRSAEAEARFAAGQPGPSGAPAALLGFGPSGSIELDVYPVPPRAAVRVEHTIRLPVAYAEGRYVARLPAWEKEARVRIHTTAGDSIEMDGVTRGSDVTLASRGNVDVAVHPALEGLEGGLASIATGQRELVSLRIAAGTLGHVPDRAAVVVAIDTSRSMAGAIEAEVALARGYLAGFPSAEVTVLTFDRSVRAPFGIAVPVEKAVEALGSTTLRDGNGSNVDAALAEADRILARSPLADRRLVLLTDLVVKDELDPDRVAAAVRTSHALLHVALVGAEGGTSLRREDAGPWARLPRGTGGVLWVASAQADEPVEARKVFEELVRPMRLDAVKVTGMPVSFVAPDRIDEGTSAGGTLLAPAAVERVTVRGELWSRPVRWSVRASEGEARRAAALAASSDIFDELTEPEQVAVATYGHAVSSVTSLVTPGPRPPPRPVEITGGSFAGGSCGTHCGCHIGTLGGREPAFDADLFLDEQLAAAARACGAGHATLTLETTSDEIVDVREVSARGGAAAASCVREAMWSLALPGPFRRRPHATFTVGAKPPP